MKWWFIIGLVVLAVALVAVLRITGYAQSTPTASPTATPTPTAPAMCTITGTVVDAGGNPFVNGTITFNSLRIQVINGIAVNPTVVTTNTDTQGHILAKAMPQGLAMQVTICPGTQQTSNCSAPFSVIVPFSQTADFGNLAQGTDLTGSGALQVTTLNVTQSMSFPDGTTWNGTGLVAPTTSGDLYYTFQDGATWNWNGINSLTNLNMANGGNIFLDGPSGTEIQIGGQATPYIPSQSWDMNGLHSVRAIGLDTTATLPPNTLLIGNTSTSSILWGSPTAPTGSILGYSASDNLNVTGGAHYNGTNWIADATTAQNTSWGNDGIDFYVNTGLTVGQTVNFTQMAQVNTSGLAIKNGFLASFSNPSAAETINAENQTMTLNNGASAPLPVCAGLVVIDDRMLNGLVCMFLAGHGTVNIVSQIGSWCVANTGTPAAGTISLAYDGTTFRLYNNLGGQTVLGIFNVCTRTYAD